MSALVQLIQDYVDHVGLDEFAIQHIKEKRVESVLISESFLSDVPREIEKLMFTTHAVAHIGDNYELLNVTRPYVSWIVDDAAGIDSSKAIERRSAERLHDCLGAGTRSGRSKSQGTTVARFGPLKERPRRISGGLATAAMGGSW